jgi:uncharacterized protein YecE (DUF72 family)
MAGEPPAQGTLFELPPPRAPADIEPAAQKPEHVTLAGALPESVRLGGMTWSYPGWAGHVYGLGATEKQLAARGLTAYSKHPLLRSVEIDRTYYEPLGSLDFEAYASQVPDDFRFFVKAHEDCVVRRFPLHARYGQKRGLDNPLFLDPVYAERAVIEPTRAGLGSRLGGLLFQFPPQDVSQPSAFVHRLHGFLRRLPRGVCYAVELRNSELLTPEYGAALADAGAVHCHSVWTGMPGVLAQARLIPPAARRPIVVRWLLRQDDRYQDAEARFRPFHRLVSEDPQNRDEVATLVAKASAHGVPVQVLVDNKAEGCAPESIVRLAASVVRKLSRFAP